MTGLHTMTEALNLPDPLGLENGTSISTQEQWETLRRSELLTLFADEIYGHAPAPSKYITTFKIVDTKEMMLGDITATRKRVNIYLETERGETYFEVLIFLPAQAEPSPCFLLICNRDQEHLDPTRMIKSDFWPVETILKQGYAAAAFMNREVAPDDPDLTWRYGMKRLFKQTAQSEASSWGTIAAWSWGASRAMDYFETDPDIDASKVAIVGHSRGGKAALWAGASDERFAMVVSNNSGCSGAALARRKSGERVKDINDRFPHWFADNYKKYNDAEDDLPVDQHTLLALIAPRKVYVASASDDAWADPQGEYLAWQMAAPVYQLYDKGLGIAPKNFEPGIQHWIGNMGYHLRPGKHNLMVYDWKRYLKFAGW